MAAVQLPTMLSKHDSQKNQVLRVYTPYTGISEKVAEGFVACCIARPKCIVDHM
jgi:hypothetical protein